MLEAQKVIKKIEAEAAEFVPKSTIVCLRFQSYDIEDTSSLDRHFITTISDVLHTPAQAWCEYYILYIVALDVHYWLSAFFSTYLNKGRGSVFFFFNFTTFCTLCMPWLGCKCSIQLWFGAICKRPSLKRHLWYYNCRQHILQLMFPAAEVCLSKCSCVDVSAWNVPIWAPISWSSSIKSDKAWIPAQGLSDPWSTSSRLLPSNQLLLQVVHGVLRWFSPLLIVHVSKHSQLCLLGHGLQVVGYSHWKTAVCTHQSSVVQAETRWLELLLEKLLAGEILAQIT